MRPEVNDDHDEARSSPVNPQVSDQHPPGASWACAVTVPSECRLPDSPTAPHTARNFVRRTACRLHQTNLEDACLLVSEVVTNALVHGDPPLALSCRCVRTAALFSVTDHRRRREPITPRAAAADDESGRGLAIVAFLASDWGVSDDLDGKSVWFRLENPSPVA